MNSFLPYAHQSISKEDLDAVSRALTEEFITRGPQVEAFEQEVAAYCGAQYAVAFNSGTAALVASCFAADLGASDRLISTANTFIGTIAGASAFGATPVLVDSEGETGNAKLEPLIETANQPATRGKSVLIPVHFSGIPVDMETLEREINAPDAVIIEDAAHAIGSRYSVDGPRVGSCAFSQMTVFSFHPAKTITTGEGGMVTTNDESFYQRLKLFRNNGIERRADSWFYEVQTISNNYNFTAFQAALGRSQLARIDPFIEKRRALVRAYREGLKDVSQVKLFTDRHDASTAFHLFVVQIDFEKCRTSRAKVMQQLKEAGIGTQVHYIPLYRHPACSRQWGDLQEFFPGMEAYYAKALTLPLYYDMSEEDVGRVVRELKKALSA